MFIISKLNGNMLHLHSYGTISKNRHFDFLDIIRFVIIVMKSRGKYLNKQILYHIAGLWLYFQLFKPNILFNTFINNPNIFSRYPRLTKACHRIERNICRSFDDISNSSRQWLTIIKLVFVDRKETYFNHFFCSSC